MSSVGRGSPTGVIILHGHHTVAFCRSTYAQIAVGVAGLSCRCHGLGRWCRSLASLVSRAFVSPITTQGHGSLDVMVTVRPCTWFGRWMPPSDWPQFYPTPPYADFTYPTWLQSHLPFHHAHPYNKPSILLFFHIQTPQKTHHQQQQH
ncbi:hypothetical protein L6452_22771 [Arctium lappa]|uniref:Uncharacterized protein n=1 Tax=Arctium lappa TaxID=4217 RepID=A0ACB9AZU9_ARCLA|nr:hypothetical protein L6452_22771 [Arctium lappa]